MNPLRILIADDHELIRKGLRALLESQAGWQICGEAVNGRQAVELARQLKPDITVMDVTMPELNGLDATRQILKDRPKTEVLILTVHESEQLVSEVLATGARGYILKGDTTRLLFTAIEAIAQHKPFFTGAASEVVLGGYLRPVQPVQKEGLVLPRLTAREREIVQLLTEGGSNKEVAVALGISIKTVDAHRANVMHKLNLHSVTELVRYAIRNHIIAA
ncbi:MAG: response regulator transcription factor [bacterium]